MHTVTINLGEYFWGVHPYEVDYGNEGFGTHYNHNHNGVLVPGTII